MCKSLLWGEENQSEKAFAYFWEKMGAPDGSTEVPNLPAQGLVMCFVIQEDHSSRGLFLHSLSFFPGDSNLLPNLHQTPIPGAPAELGFTFLRCQTGVTLLNPLHPGPVAFLNPLQALLKGLGFVCMLTLHEKQFILSLFGDRSG